MKVYLSLLLCLFFCTCVRAQETLPGYRQLVDEAQEAYQKNKPRKALNLYQQAFLINKKQVVDVLRATVIAESIKNLAAAKEFFTYLFDYHPLETAITFLEDPEFEPNRSGPFYEMFIHRAAFGMAPEQNGRIQLGRFDKVAHRYAMPNDRYILLVEIAHRSMIKKDYQRAIYYYELAFSMKRKSQLSLLRAAACYFHNNDQDIAATYLEEAFKSFPVFALKIIRLMPEFQEPLAHTPFVAMVGREISRHFPSMDSPLVAEIDSLNKLFLTYRSLESGQNASLVPPSYSLAIPDAKNRAKQDIIDRIISARMDSLIQIRGYPTTALIADRLPEFDRLFYAVDPKVILIHWEKIMYGSSVEEFSNFRKSSYLASRYDYNCFSRGIKQRFGSIWFVPELLKNTRIAVWPIEHPLEVDERRIAMGMETMKQHTKSCRCKKKYNLKAQQGIGELPLSVRDEVHARFHSQKELSGFPYDYQ